MSTNFERQQIYQKFKESKEYRDAFIAEHIYSRLPAKIRGLREQRGWSQKTLGEKVGMAQAWVSRLEDPRYGKYTIVTLLRLASAFDVGLDIDFTLFSEILDKALTLTPASFGVMSFADDPGFVQYRTGTAEQLEAEPITSEARQEMPDRRTEYDVSRQQDISRPDVTATDDTQSLIGPMPIEERDVAQTLQELTAYAATAS